MISRVFFNLICVINLLDAKGILSKNLIIFTTALAAYYTKDKRAP